MRESVSAVFISKEKGTLFSMVRQNYLSVFPGYTSFPGGKVDRDDRNKPKDVPEKFISEISNIHWSALDREMKEELDFSLERNIDNIRDIYLLGIAITPEFNPYRFKSYFYIVILDNEIEFNVDSGETKSSEWIVPELLYQRYCQSELLAVPPTLNMIKALSNNLYCRGPHHFKLETIEGLEVPMIESVKGVKQFMPLSHTFPPANRTNCFLVGDAPNRFIIDPSPKDREEFEKLCRSLDRYEFDHIFISHHHPDHHEHLRWMVERYKKKVFLSKTTEAFIKAKYGEKYFLDMELVHVSEGDVISKSMGSDLRVYEVPGHDEGQLAVAPDSMNWFFVGDLIQTVGTVVIGGKEGDMTKYFHSLRKVIELDPKVCFPSHGIALGGTDKLSKTLRHRLLREKKIRELLDGKHSEEEIVGIIYEGLEERLVPYARATIRAHIEKISKEKGSVNSL